MPDVTEPNDPPEGGANALAVSIVLYSIFFYSMFLLSPKEISGDGRLILREHPFTFTLRCSQPMLYNKHHPPALRSFVSLFVAHCELVKVAVQQSNTKELNKRKIKKQRIREQK
jgi:hypothetical protein